MSEIIFLGSIFCSLLTAYILLFKLPEYQQFSGKLLAMLMLFFGWSAMNYLLISSGWLLQVPFLLKSGAAVNFFVPPFIFFYIRSVLKDQKGFTSADFLHLLPALLVFINYLPVYFLPIEEKKDLIREIISNFSTIYLKGQGYFSDMVIFILRMLQALIYLYFQFRLLWGYNKEGLFGSYQTHTIKVFDWLNVFNWLYVIGFLGNFSLFIIVSIDPSLANSSQILMVPAYMLALSFLGISSYLLIHPEVLFGLPYVAPAIDEVKEKKEVEDVSKREYSHEIDILNHYFEERMPYLDNNLNINKVAVETGIHSREISFIINQHFNQRFTDFVNAYRIRHINQKILSGYLNDFTIESLYKESGFSSKSTFNTAFKKINQCTPSEFIAKNTQQI